MRSARTGPATTSSALPIRWPTSRRRSTAPRSPTTTPTSSGRRTARSTPLSERTRSGSGCSRATRRRPSTLRSTRRCPTSSPAARRPSRIRTSSVSVSAALRRRPIVDVAGRAGLARALAEPTFELLPLKSAEAQSEFVPAGAWVSVTASPAKGIEATVELAVSLQARGYRAIPHLSARMVRDRAHLRELLSRLTDGGVAALFVVGGDAEEPGDYKDGLALLRAIADLGVTF